MKGFLVAACWTVLLSLAAGAQQQPAQNIRPATISGIVVKSNSAEPVKKARVTLYSTTYASGRTSNEPITTTTDASGSFEFTGIAPGEYRAVPSRSGYASRLGHSNAGQLLTVSAGQQVRNIILRISPSAAITGRVLDEDGEPMANVTITALQYRYMLHSRRLMPVNAAQTDDRGEFRIGELRPGRYFVQASANASEAPKGMRYAPCFYPEAASPEAASLIQLRAGDESEATFHLVPAKAVNIKGQIVGHDPKQHYNLMLTQPGFEFPMRDNGQSSVRPDGSFVIKDVLPGTYTLVAFTYGNPAVIRAASGGMSSDFEPQMSMAQQQIEVGETDLDGIRLNLFESAKQIAEVTGEIKLESASSRPVDQLRVMAMPTRLESFPDFLGMAQGGSARVKKDGSFALKLNSGARYFTNINAMNRDFEDYYTMSVTYGGRDATDNGFTVGPTPGRLQIVVADDGARIDGTVLGANSRPYPGASVVAIPEARYRDWYEIYGHAETDQNGRFTLRGLRPGDYTLYAFEDLQDGAFMDQDYMRPYEQLGVSVHAKSNGRYDVGLKLIPETDAELE